VSWYVRRHYAHRSMYIESPATESEEQFRAYVTELLTSIYGRVPEWAEFRVGRRVERQGVKLQVTGSSIARRTGFLGFVLLLFEHWTGGEIDSR